MFFGELFFKLSKETYGMAQTFYIAILYYNGLISVKSCPNMSNPLKNRNQFPVYTYIITLFIPFDFTYFTSCSMSYDTATLSDRVRHGGVYSVHPDRLLFYSPTSGTATDRWPLKVATTRGLCLPRKHGLLNETV